MTLVRDRSEAMQQKYFADPQSLAMIDVKSFRKHTLLIGEAVLESVKIEYDVCST